MKYAHLKQEQRYVISVMLQSDRHYSLTDIAREIGVSKSTVSREIRRNCDMRGRHHYDSGLAERKAKARMAGRRHCVRFTPGMRKAVESLITREQLSPEQIVGRSRLTGKAMVSHETIYKFVWEEKRRGNTGMAENLRRKGRRYARRGGAYRSRGVIRNRVGIEHRPAIVDGKRRFGDLEIDTIIGRNHKGAIMTIVDRCTRIVLIRKLGGKEAESLANAAIRALWPLRHLIHTITADNGKEFARHEDIAAALGIDFYFARPYHSWERGANENVNGLIRQYIPKHTDFDNISDDFVMAVQDKLNNRPRKSTGFYSPLEFSKRILNFALDNVALSS